MHCPYCKSEQTDVVETRVNEDKSSIRRRRTCSECTKRFTTYERIENTPILVKKHDGRREQFNRDKLKAGLIRASEKTKVSFDDIARIVDEIERDLRSSDSVEVESKHIGDTAALKLKQVDKIAYIRFASVFKRFLDVEDFERELKKLIG